MNIKLRYLFGVPYLFFMAMAGQNILFDAIMIGVLAGFTDMRNDSDNNIRPS